ncbi:hypothetical protein Tco_1432506 [Tanacetum coccineum]
MILIEGAILVSSKQVLPDLTHYVTLAGKLHKLAVQLVRDGSVACVKVPYLTKVGALDVDVSLEGNIILCTQVDQPSIIRSVSSILDDDNVIISSMSFGRIAQRKQAVMVIGVDEKPSKKALKKIDEIPDVEFVFLAL